MTNHFCNYTLILGWNLKPFYRSLFVILCILSFFSQLKCEFFIFNYYYYFNINMCMRSHTHTSSVTFKPKKFFCNYNLFIIKKSGWLLKVDFVEAVDCMDLDFLEEVLWLIGFHWQWILWIMGWVRSFKCFVFINGHPCGETLAMQGVEASWSTSFISFSNLKWGFWSFTRYHLIQRGW